MIHKNIHIAGRVQGVGFRYATRHKAIQMDIRGFVKNLSNGNVYIEAEGNEDAMESFIKWCQEGPPRAVVKFVDIYDAEITGFHEFEIR